MLRFPGILSLPGIMLPVPLPSKNEQSIEHLLSCRKNTSTCASSMPCQSCQLMWAFMRRSSSYRSQVLKKGNTCGCQPVTTVREPSSSQFPYSSEIRSMKNFSSGMLKDTSLSLADTSDLVLGRVFCCLCCETASRNTVASRNHVACCSSEQE